MRIPLLACLALAAAAPSATLAAGEWRIAPPATASSRSVDLNRPGALDAIRDQDPGRHERVTSILRAASEGECRMPELERLMVSHDARAVNCSALLMASFPPKRMLSFVLENTHYVATVTMSTRGFGVKPADR